MDKFKKIIPCIFIEHGKAVKWINDKEVLTEDVVGLAKGYYEKGADELLIMDLSDDDDDHEETLNLLRRITRVVRIPVVTGGNVKRLEDVKKILYAGAKRAIINFSRKDGTKLLEAAEKRFGKEKEDFLIEHMDIVTMDSHGDRATNAVNIAKILWENGQQHWLGGVCIDVDPEKGIIGGHPLITKY